MFFYIPDLNQSFSEQIIQGENAKHLLVMRVRAGQQVILTNLQGLRLTVKILESDKNTKTIKFQVLESQFFGDNFGDILGIKENDLTQRLNNNLNHDLNHDLGRLPKTLFQSLLSKEYLEKLYEVVPLSNFDQVFLFGSALSVTEEINWTRLHKILIRSCEQSEAVFGPKITVLKTKEELKELLLKYQPKVLDCAVNSDICNANNPQNPSSDLSFRGTKQSIIVEQNDQSVKLQNSSSYIVGPEGGWTKSERECFGVLGLESISLGTKIYPAWIAGLIAGEL